MEVINSFDNIDECADENMMNETVGVVLEEAEIVDCDADVEADDDNIQYHLYAVNRGDNAVTYKVVHVSDNHRENNELSIATPVNNAVQVLATPMNGQFYVLSSNGGEVVASDSTVSTTPCVAKLQVEGSPNIITGIKKRDERRRVTHNEVERRRRDKINNWISKLGKLLPDCDQHTSGEGDVKTTLESQSKGGILARACEYITELKEIREKLAQCVDEHAQLLEQAKNLRQVLNDLRSENSKLKAQVSKNPTFILET